MASASEAGSPDQVPAARVLRLTQQDSGSSVKQAVDEVVKNFQCWRCGSVGKATWITAAEKAPAVSQRGVSKPTGKYIGRVPEMTSQDSKLAIEQPTSKTKTPSAPLVNRLPFLSRGPSTQTPSIPTAVNGDVAFAFRPDRRKDTLRATFQRSDNPPTRKELKEWEHVMQDLFEELARKSATHVSPRGPHHTAVFSRQKQAGPLLDKAVFMQLFAQVPGVVGERLFSVFDKDNSGYIDFQEFFAGLAVLYSADLAQKLRFIFNMYDLNGDGFISRDEFAAMLSHIPASLIFLRDGGRAARRAQRTLATGNHPADLSEQSGTHRHRRFSVPGNLPVPQELAQVTLTPAGADRRRSKTLAPQPRLGGHEIEGKWALVLMPGALGQDQSDEPEVSPEDMKFQEATPGLKGARDASLMAAFDVLIDDVVDQAFSVADARIQHALVSLQSTTDPAQREALLKQSQMKGLSFEDFCRAVLVFPKMRTALEIFCQESIRPQDFRVSIPMHVLQSFQNPQSPIQLSLSTSLEAQLKAAQFQSPPPNVPALHIVGTDFSTDVQPLKSPKGDASLSSTQPRQHVFHLLSLQCGVCGFKYDTRLVSLAAETPASIENVARDVSSICTFTPPSLALPADSVTTQSLRDDRFDSRSSLRFDPRDFEMKKELSSKGFPTLPAVPPVSPLARPSVSHLVLVPELMMFQETQQESSKLDEVTAIENATCVLCSTLQSFAVHDGVAAMAGWLEKDHRRLSGSLRRFYILKEQFLYYYQYPSSPTPIKALMLAGAKCEPLRSTKVTPEGTIAGRQASYSTNGKDERRFAVSHGGGVMPGLASSDCCKAVPQSPLFPESQGVLTKDPELLLEMQSSYSDSAYEVYLRQFLKDPKKFPSRFGLKLLLNGVKEATLYCDSADSRDSWVRSLSRAAHTDAAFHDFYVLKECLGHGKFGRVYRAEEKATHARVAVKILPKTKPKETHMGTGVVDRLKGKLGFTTGTLPGHGEADAWGHGSTTGGLIPEFQRTEVAVLRLLHNKHLVQLLDVHETSDFLYIVMEWGPSGDLRKLIETLKLVNGILAAEFTHIPPHAKNDVPVWCRQIWIPEIIVREIARSCAEGLKYLHSPKRNIIHRDLKPDNLLLTIPTDKLLLDSRDAVPELQILLRDSVFSPSTPGSGPHYMSNKPLTTPHDPEPSDTVAVESAYTGDHSVAKKKPPLRSDTIDSRQLVPEACDSYDDGFSPSGVEVRPIRAGRMSRYELRDCLNTVAMSEDKFRLVKHEMLHPHLVELLNFRQYLGCLKWYEGLISSTAPRSGSRGLFNESGTVREWDQPAGQSNVGVTTPGPPSVENVPDVFRLVWGLSSKELNYLESSGAVSSWDRWLLSREYSSLICAKITDFGLSKIVAPPTTTDRRALEALRKLTRAEVDQGAILKLANKEKLDGQAKRLEIERERDSLVQSEPVQIEKLELSPRPQGGCTEALAGFFKRRSDSKISEKAYFGSAESRLMAESRGVVGMAEFANEPLGTLPFAAPEVLFGQEYSTSADLWSMGVMVYQLFSGGNFPRFTLKRRSELAGSGDSSSGDERGRSGLAESNRADAEAKRGRWRRFGRKNVSGKVSSNQEQNIQKPEDVFGTEEDILSLLFLPPNMWDRVSDAAKDFVSKLLVPKSSARLTAVECLDHPWLKIRDPHLSIPKSEPSKGDTSAVSIEINEGR